MLENRCIVCHNGTSDPPALLNYDNLVSPSTRDPSKSRAAAAVDLLQGQAMPPRPAVPPEPDEIQSFVDWVGQGTPKNPQSCTDYLPPAKTGGGGGDGGSVILPGDGGAGTCTSGVFWALGDTKSEILWERLS